MVLREENGRGAIRAYGCDAKSLIRDLKNQREATLKRLKEYLRAAPHTDENARSLVRSVLHALGERTLQAGEIQAAEQILRMRPDISVWHMMGALKVAQKGKAGQQRVKTIRRLLAHDDFANPDTVRAAMGAYYDQRIGHHVKGMLKQKTYLDHEAARRELVHNLAFMLARHENSEKLVHPYIVQLAGHDAVYAELENILETGSVRYTFGT